MFEKADIGLESKPQLDLKFSGSALNFTLDGNLSGAEVRTDKGKFIWEKGGKTCRIYSHSRGGENIIVDGKQVTFSENEFTNGGLQFDVVYSSKPSSLVENFLITNDRINLVKQESKPWELKDWDAHNWKGERVTRVGKCFRPIHMEGGFVGFDSNWKKLFNLPRFILIDATGKKTFVDNMTYNAGMLSVYLPDKFMSEAAYPVILDPTFGMTTIGASTTYYTEGGWGSKHSTGFAGTTSNILAYIQSTGTANFRGAFYSDVSGVPTTRLATAGANATMNTTAAWRTSNISYAHSNTTLWPFVGGDDFINIAYDAGGTSQSFESNTFTYPTFPNPGSIFSYFDVVFSLYSNSTASSSPSKLALLGVG